VFVKEWKQSVGVSDRDQVVPINLLRRERAQFISIDLAACGMEDQIIFGTIVAHLSNSFSNLK
jgi:hypothetical protein